MARLNPTLAEKVAAAETGFKPVDPGVYRLQLVEDVDERMGDKGPYWRWTFVVAELDGDGNEQPFAGRKLWNNTSHSEASFGMMKELFAAFGVTPEADTEDLVGKFIRATVKTVIVQKGNRKGETNNEIGKFIPDDGPMAPEGSADGPAMTKAGAAPGTKVEPLF